MARTQRGSVMPDGVTRLSHASCDTRRHRELVRLDDHVRLLLAEQRARSSSPGPRATCFGAGMSFGSPCGAPASTHRTIVSICSSVSERSFLNFWMPTRLVDVPRRHLPVGDAGLDRARPRPRLLVGHERHRRDRIGPVARFALLLEDRRDVLGERRRRRPAPASARLPAPSQHQRHRPRAHRRRRMCPSIIRILFVTSRVT